jgi:guanylate kinase
MEKSDFIQWAKKLQHSYVPSDDTVKDLSQIDLIAIVGPTGVGKSTIIDKLDIPYVLSDVSRPPRPGEKNGQNYYFRTDYLNIIKEIKNGDFVQFLVNNNDEFYGTKRANYPDSGACTMAVKAEVMPQFRNLGFRSVKSLYIMPPSYVEWMRRIGGVRTTDLLARISEARQSILLATNDEKYSFILNDDLNAAVEDVLNIINGKEVNQRRSQLAFDTADIILEHIGDEEDR